ncbi:hypothetical protein THTE_1830 [Thermogutta terrifontis]|uniref:Uncharacterized protein n=1 Tax=Thermogutta terrifontis TaxID=1331910 RepID=A0A286REQ5_9BACT|nr:hypothetical protein THTE_1830 [Thermogutta terrifontis]
MGKREADGIGLESSGSRTRGQVPPGEELRHPFYAVPEGDLL